MSASASAGAGAGAGEGARRTGMAGLYVKEEAAVEQADDAASDGGEDEEAATGTGMKTMWWRLWLALELGRRERARERSMQRLRVQDGRRRKPVAHYLRWRGLWRWCWCCQWRACDCGPLGVCTSDVGGRRATDEVLRWGARHKQTRQRQPAAGAEPGYWGGMSISVLGGEDGLGTGTGHEFGRVPVLSAAQRLKFHQLAHVLMLMHVRERPARAERRMGREQSD